MPTIANQPITRGSIREVEQGDWFGDIATQSGELIPNGTRVEIVAETKRWNGAIVRGGITDAVGRYQVAGRPEWGNPLPARASAAYRSAANVLRKTVLSDLARDVLGSSWTSLIVMPPEAQFGQHYLRPGTFGDTTVTGRDALELLGLFWYVRDDGATVFAERPTGAVATEERILVEYRNDAIGYRVVNCEDPAAFAPGLTFEGETIGEVVHSFTGDDLKIHVWTRAASNAFAEAIRTVWRRLFPRAELQGLYTYVVVGPSQNGKHDLRSMRSRHLPDTKLVDNWTVAGHSSELIPGTRVLLAFADADPSSPVLVAVEPGAVPVSSSFEATTTLSADGASVELGDAFARVLRTGDTVTLTGPLTPSGPNTVTIQLNPLDPLTVVPTKVKA